MRLLSRFFGNSRAPHAKDFQPRKDPAAEGWEDAAAPETLQFDNGWGGFAAGGREYVIQLRPDANGDLRVPPRPWTHIVANPQAGTILTERGALSTWAFNSRENRLTSWSNDPVTDPCEEILYLREGASRAYWSPLPGPLRDGCPCTVRYGFGYATYQKVCHRFRHETTVFVPQDDPLRVVRLSLENLDRQSREVELISYHPWVLGNGVASDGPPIETSWEPELRVLLAQRTGHSDDEQCLAFSGLFSDPDGSIVHYSTNRTAFLGRWGSVESPAAVVRPGDLDGAVGVGDNPCAALQRRVRIPAGGCVTVWWILGQAPSADAHDLIGRYRSSATVSQELDRVVQYWRGLLGTLQVSTPSPEFNLLLNGWLTYQNVVCRMWGRSSYYQGGGAFGFRDQLQDACALRWHRPAWTRQQVLLHAAHQFVEGDVLHWWHPPDARGLRTRFSDDLLWLPWAALEYVDATGDDAVWDTQVPFREGATLDHGELERFIASFPSQETATLYEHCGRALDKSGARGAHGLPLIGCGDWNDGFSRVGAAGRGESVWVALFLCEILPRFIDVCCSRGDQERAARYRAWQVVLHEAVNDQGWDGNWYRRAFLDNGEPLGSHLNNECRIDALAQAWAVLAGVADGDRARRGSCSRWKSSSSTKHTVSFAC